MDFDDMFTGAVLVGVLILLLLYSLIKSYLECRYDLNRIEAYGKVGTQVITIKK